MRPSRDALYIIVIFLLAAVCGQLWYSYTYAPAQEIKVYYNKDIEADQQIVGVIQHAQKFVYFAIYTFTLPEIKDALLAAKHRGLTVTGIVDKNQLHSLPSQQKIVSELKAAGIPIETQDHSAIMHIKAVVTDQGYASGSYNWTAAATNDNDEILEVGTKESVRRQYEKDLREVLARYAHMLY